MGRLGKSSPSAQPDSAVIRTWLEYVIELALVAKKSEAPAGSEAASRDFLDEDHFLGIAKGVKERIIEQLAVLKLESGSQVAQVFCASSYAPGAGKTSLGQSIARALGRKSLERMSTWAACTMKAELRGHRRTYIGRLSPGRRMGEAMRRAGFANPVLMLDEVDKLKARLPGRSGGGVAGSARPRAE